MLKIVLYGYTGSGKSTSAGILKKILEDQGKKVTVLKLAQPLYELQSHFYRVAGKPIEFYQQDQELLEKIAFSLRKISPVSIVEDFLKRLKTIKTDVVLNDDLRDTKDDYPILKENGFKFIRVVCDEAIRLQRLGLRNDISICANSSTTNNIDMITPDALIDTTDGNITLLQERIKNALEGLL